MDRQTDDPVSHVFLTDLCIPKTICAKLFSNPPSSCFLNNIFKALLIYILNRKKWSHPMQQSFSKNQINLKNLDSGTPKDRGF